MFLLEFDELLKHTDASLVLVIVAAGMDTSECIINIFLSVCHQMLVQ